MILQLNRLYFVNSIIIVFIVNNVQCVDFVWREMVYYFGDYHGDKCALIDARETNLCSTLSFTFSSPP